jgi:hypothetical protein
MAFGLIMQVFSHWSRWNAADSEDVTRKEVLRVMRYVDEEKRRRQGGSDQ